MPQLTDPSTPKKPAPPYDPSGYELTVQRYLRERLPVLKETKKRVAPGNVDFLAIMREADREYQPNLLLSTKSSSKNSTFLVTDEVTGLRGARITRIGSEDDEWRSDVSEPTLFVKLQTALSILIDQNPEAVFKATLDKYKKTAPFVHSLWKRSWNIAKSKRQLKLFIFDLAKYGWAIGRTYPRIVRREGQILTELDTENPENNKYRDATTTLFNDVYREKLDPYRTWIDDMTNLTDPWSMGDWYFEKDYSRDAFMREFSQYSNHKHVEFGRRPAEAESDVEDGDIDGETAEREDIVTVGFYESTDKDLYSLYVPGQDIVLYDAPIPNDEKRLSCWQTYWNERDPRTPYGIGLYEMIKNNKVLRDRLSNMTIDQLVMAIYPMLFYSGPVSQGDFTVSPAVVKQKLPGTSIEQVKVDYDPRGIEAIQFLDERLDENSGISPTLQGEIVGKTLGEMLHAKDAALKRLSTPLDNIAEALQDEGYISLSWMAQIYSIPEVRSFTDAEDLAAYEMERGTQGQNILTNDDGTYTAEFMPTLALGLDEDKDTNELIESPNERFFTVGQDIDATALHWEGMINIVPQSILAPSQELERQRKLELFNLIEPILQSAATALIQGLPLVAQAMLKPALEILKIQGEKPEDWIPKELLLVIENPQAAMLAVQQTMTMTRPLFVPAGSTQETATATPPGSSATPPGNPQGLTPRSQSKSIGTQGDVTNPVKGVVNKIGQSM